MVQTALAIFAVKYEAAALSPARAREYLIAACVFYIKVRCSRWGRLSLSVPLCLLFHFFLHSREAADKSSKVRKFV